MSTKNGKNLNQLLFNWQRGTVYTQSYLSKMGYYHDLVKSYRRNNWLESLGGGAYKLAGDTIDLPGGVHTLQQQLNLPIHIGGRTALEMGGYAHYARFGRNKCFLFTTEIIRLPRWFSNYTWEMDIQFKTSNMFPPGMETGFTKYKHKDFTVKISAPERACMEMLYYVPGMQGFDEALKIMENLPNLRPGIVQELLENCNLIKVKRLFLFMAEKTNAPWLNELNQDRVNLGKGKRSIVTNGHFNKKYQITIPGENEY